MHAKSLQSCPTLCDPMDYSPPCSSVRGISLTRMLKWVAVSSSKGPSWPRDQTHVSCISCLLVKGKHFHVLKFRRHRSLHGASFLPTPVPGSPPKRQAWAQLLMTPSRDALCILHSHLPRALTPIHPMVHYYALWPVLCLFQFLQLGDNSTWENKFLIHFINSCTVGNSLVVQWLGVFPAGTSGKEPACQGRRHKRCGFHPWVQKIPWRRAWQRTPIFLPGESHGQRSLAIVYRVAKSWTWLKQLSMDTSHYKVLSNMLSL